jgi:hypothetical protein
MDLANIFCVNNEWDSYYYYYYYYYIYFRPAGSRQNLRP